MASPTSLKMDNGVLRPQWVRGRFFIDRRALAWDGGNRWRKRERECADRVPVVAHNGVRRDNEVGVREAREQTESPIGRGGRYYVST